MGLSSEYAAPIVTFTKMILTGLRMYRELFLAGSVVRVCSIYRHFDKTYTVIIENVRRLLLDGSVVRVCNTYCDFYKNDTSRIENVLRTVARCVSGWDKEHLLERLQK